MKRSDIFDAIAVAGIVLLILAVLCAARGCPMVGAYIHG